MKKENKFFVYVLSFTISLLLIAILVFSIVTNTVCNSSFLKKQIVNSGFSTLVLQELNENFISYGSAAGFSEEVMKNLVTTEDIYKDMFLAVDNLYTNNTIQNSSAQKTSDFYTVFEIEVKQQKYIVNEEVAEGLMLLAKSCAVDYQNYVSIPLGKYIGSVMLTVQKLSKMLLLFSVVFFLVAVILFCVLLKNIITILQHAIYIISTAILVVFFIPFFTKILLQPQKLSVQPESVKVLCVSYLQSILDNFIKYGFALVLVAGLCAGLYYYIYRIKKQKI